MSAAQDQYGNYTPLISYTGTGIPTQGTSGIATGIGAPSPNLKANIYFDVTNPTSPVMYMWNGTSFVIFSSGGGGGGTTQVFASNYGGSPPNFTPSGPSVAVDTSTGRIWWYYSGAWN